MKLYNFSEGALNFFKEYLENRMQVVQIESKRSTPKEVGDVGVPQGSVLGVLGFLIELYFTSLSLTSMTTLAYSKVHIQ